MEKTTMKCGVKFKKEELCQEGKKPKQLCCKHCNLLKTCTNPCGYIKINQECKFQR